MQQFTISDSLEAIVSICPSKEERRSQKSGRVYSREFQAMLDGLESEDCAEESGLGSEKKRRLSMDQVRALEKYFEVENKLDPDKKLKLAEELGLQPRQVAIWFQNRRARWKTKQLERDFRLLKANYDSLNADFNNLQQEKEALSAELKELKEKLQRRNAEHSSSPAMPDFAGNNFSSEQSKSGGFRDTGDATAVKSYGDFRDMGSSDSDSNGTFKEEMGGFYNGLLSPPSGCGFQNFGCPEQTNWFQLPDLRLIPAAQQQPVKMEDEGMFSSEESCNIYSVDQPPTLHCYFQD